MEFVIMKYDVEVVLISPEDWEQLLEKDPVVIHNPEE
jgi:hypothetical protein